MRIALLTHGSRGDLQPYVALAAGLQDAGFTVTLTTPPNLEDFVRRCDIPYTLISGNSQEVLESEQGRRWLSAGNVTAFLRALGDIMVDLRHDLERDIVRACEGAEAIIAHPLAEDRAQIMAEARNLPLLLGYLCPMYPSGDFAHPFVTTARLPWPFLNRLTHDVFGRLWWHSQKAMLNDFRRQMGVPTSNRSTQQRLRERPVHYLHGFSEHVQPRPADWDDSHTVTGFWRLPDGFRERLGEHLPPPGLEDWLAAGPAPVFIGFGSMPVEDPEAVLATTATLARRLQTRIVIGAGWSRLAADDLPDDLFLVRSVNHEWLFPRCRAIVHHGGAGTTAASLRAGRPTLICSVFADQPFWGRRLTELGVGAHLPFRKLTPDALEQALRTLLRPDVTQRAEALGERLRGENGVDRAVLAIKQHLGARP